MPTAQNYRWPRLPPTLRSLRPRWLGLYHICLPPLIPLDISRKAT